MATKIRSQNFSTDADDYIKLTAKGLGRFAASNFPTSADAPTAAGANALAIGRDATAGHTNSVAVGYGAVTNANNQVRLGGTTISSIRVGNINYDPSDSQDLATKGYVDSQISVTIDSAYISARASSFDSGNATGLIDSNYIFNKIEDSAKFTILQSTNNLIYNKITGPSNSTYDKIRLYGSAPYSIGFRSGDGFGPLESDFSFTFTNGFGTNRGFLFRDHQQTSSNAGAFAVNIDGKGTFAHSLRIGYGITDNVMPGATHALDVSGTILSTGATLTSLTLDGETVDSAWVNARSSSFDSGNATGLIDSAYVSARASGIDSAATLNIVDSSYIGTVVTTTRLPGKTVADMRVNPANISRSHTIDSTDNAMLVGPFDLDSGVTLTINGTLMVV